MSEDENSLIVKWADMDKSSRYILILICVFTLGAWAYIAFSGNGRSSMTMDMRPTNDAAMQTEMSARVRNSVAGISLPSLGMFIPMWLVMCLAMMLPTAVNMILCMDKLARSKYGDCRPVPLLVILFITGYLLVWIGFGALCWTAAYFAFRGLSEFLEQPLHLWLILGLIFLAAGIYQNSPFKFACLKGCQHPISFLMNHWAEGKFGAIQMGFRHGLQCSGCCAALMIIMFPLGMMNLVWMGLFTIIMFVEKNAVFGPAMSRIIGILLLIAGLSVTVVSGILCLA